MLPKILREGWVWEAVSGFLTLPLVAANLPKILRDGRFGRECARPHTSPRRTGSAPRPRIGLLQRGDHVGADRQRRTPEIVPAHEVELRPGCAVARRAATAEPI